NVTTRWCFTGHSRMPAVAMLNWRRPGSGRYRDGAHMHLFAMVASAVLIVGLRGTASADNCTRAKLAAVGKKEAGLLACHEKAAVRGDATLLGPCLAKIELQYVAAFA